MSLSMAVPSQMMIFYLEYLAPEPSFTESFLIMATDRVDDPHGFFPQPSTTSTSATLPRHHMEDTNSISYIPRMARMIPNSTTVHTIFVKKISFPMTSRPDELWILERTTDGIETWKPIETFLEIFRFHKIPECSEQRQTNGDNIMTCQ